MSEHGKRLLEAFPPHTYEEWKAAAIALLKGRPFEKTLNTPTYEGFDLDPIYMRGDISGLGHIGSQPGLGSQVRSSRLAGYLEAGWQVSQELGTGSPATLNAQILEGLENGQDEVNLWLDLPGRLGADPGSNESASGGICGLSLANADDFKALFKDVHLDAVSLYIQSGAAAPAIYAMVLAYLGDAAKQQTGCIAMDPVTVLAERGKLPGSESEVFDRMAGLLAHSAEAAPALQVIEVKGHTYHNGGASSTQEMAAMLATGVCYLREMQARGLEPATVASRMRFSISIGGNTFLEIAKLRAFRLLWNRILEALEVADEDRFLHLHARTGIYNKTVYDPYVNMLRTTTEAFSAVVGGCDSLHVAPFDEVLRESDAFSRRIARNTHAILAEECEMRQVIDPAGGSYAVETLTDKMAEKAWELFQGIEAEGGILKALLSGSLQEAVASVREKRAQNLHRRRNVIVGTNQYPNATEELLQGGSLNYAEVQAERVAALAAGKSQRDGASVESLLAQASEVGGADCFSVLVEAAGKGATLGELSAACGVTKAGPSAEPIALRRAAEDFEKLRMAADQLKASGTAPVLHQLNMGPSRRYRLRADWTSSFFQVGGFTLLNEDDYAEIADAVAALKESGARIAVITSDDDTYAATVTDLTKAIKSEVGDITVLVAGAPGDKEAEWKAAGVDDFVHVRVNNYAFNRDLLSGLGAQV
jgi:methylmalonyl-CoA mutase